MCYDRPFMARARGRSDSGSAVACLPLAPDRRPTPRRSGSARPDGTVEFTNVAPRGTSGPGEESRKADLGSRRVSARRARSSAGGARRARDARVAPPSSQRRAAVPRRGRSRPAPGSVVWAREHDDGTVEFTNVTPGRRALEGAVPDRAGQGRGAARPSDLVPPRDALAVALLALRRAHPRSAGVLRDPAGVHARGDQDRVRLRSARRLQRRRAWG